MHAASGHLILPRLMNAHKHTKRSQRTVMQTNTCWARHNCWWIIKSRKVQLKVYENCLQQLSLYNIISNGSSSNPHLSSPFCRWGSADSLKHMSIDGCGWCSDTSACSLHCPSHTHFLSHNLYAIIIDNKYVKIRLRTRNTCTYVYKLPLHFFYNAYGT